MGADEVFTLHDVYDYAYASDGQSRYRAHLAQNVDRFRYGGEALTVDPAEFTAAAFVVASPPIMSPSYVGRHPRVVHAMPCWDIDRRCAIHLELAIPLAARIADQLPPRVGGWRWDPSSTRYYEPDENNEPTACMRLAVRVPLAVDLLPQPAYGRDGVPDVDIAKRALRALCAHANSLLTHLIISLEPQNDEQLFR
jgi:hypothetical protein